MESLKTELERKKKETCQAEDKYKDALHHWQAKVIPINSIDFIINRNSYNNVVITTSVCRRTTTESDIEGTSRIYRS